MLIGKTDHKFINLKTQRDEYLFRFCNFVDQDIVDFEELKIRKIPNERFIIQDETKVEREISWPNLTYWQSYHYYSHQSGPFYLMQMSNIKTDRHYQIVIKVEVSKISFFSVGTVEKWIFNPNEESRRDLNELIEQLFTFLKNHTTIMSLRLQPYMPGEKNLELLHRMLAPKGFTDIKPKSYIKTRIIDLRPSVVEILNAFSANGRARLKIKEKELGNVEVREIFEKAAIPHLQDALNDSYQRSEKKLSPFNFHPFFESAKHFTKDIVLLGFFLKESPGHPKAFISGISHDNVVEYSVSGSLSDPQLRQFPFNHILMWQLALKSKANGIELLDMGGITNAGEHDPLRGISNFKRLFPGFEISTGREMQFVLRPNILSIYISIQRSLAWINQKAARTK